MGNKLSKLEEEVKTSIINRRPANARQAVDRYKSTNESVDVFKLIDKNPEDEEHDNYDFVLFTLKHNREDTALDFLNLFKDIVLANNRSSKKAEFTSPQLDKIKYGGYLEFVVYKVPSIGTFRFMLDNQDVFPSKQQPSSPSPIFHYLCSNPVSFELIREYLSSGKLDERFKNANRDNDDSDSMRKIAIEEHVMKTDPIFAFLNGKTPLQVCCCYRNLFAVWELVAQQLGGTNYLECFNTVIEQSCKKNDYTAVDMLEAIIAQPGARDIIRNHRFDIHDPSSRRQYAATAKYLFDIEVADLGGQTHEPCDRDFKFVYPYMFLETQMRDSRLELQFETKYQRMNSNRSSEAPFGVQTSPIFNFLLKNQCFGPADDKWRSRQFSPRLRRAVLQGNIYVVRDLLYKAAGHRWAFSLADDHITLMKAREADRFDICAMMQRCGAQDPPSKSGRYSEYTFMVNEFRHRDESLVCSTNRMSTSNYRLLTEMVGLGHLDLVKEFFEICSKKGFSKLLFDFRMENNGESLLQLASRGVQSGGQMIEFFTELMKKDFGEDYLKEQLECKNNDGDNALTIVCKSIVISFDVISTLLNTFQKLVEDENYVKKMLDTTGKDEASGDNLSPFALFCCNLESVDSEEASLSILKLFVSWLKNTGGFPHLKEHIYDTKILSKTTLLQKVCEISDSREFLEFFSATLLQVGPFTEQFDALESAEKKKLISMGIDRKFNGTREQMRPPILGSTEPGNMYAMFKQFDFDGDGELGRGEILPMMIHFFPEMSASAIKKRVEEADVNSDGKLSFDEFCTIAKDLNDE